jgi:hypothetical protein
VIYNRGWKDVEDGDETEDKLGRPEGWSHMTPHLTDIIIQYLSNVLRSLWP